MSVGFSLFSALIIHRGWITKKTSVVIGMVLLTVTGLAAVFLHQQIWHLVLFSVLIGAGMGFFISTSASILFDNFDERERRMSIGVQTSVINLGGIFISAIGGFLASVVWYGGYVLLLMAAPVVVVCIIMIPRDKQLPAETVGADQKPVKTKVPLDIFYYGIITFVFLLIFPVGSTNISNHIKAAGLGNTATAGIATAVQMAGGVFSGLIYSKLSARLKDYMIPLAFMIVAAGYITISLGFTSLAVDLIGVFIAGTAISVMVPQCLFSTSCRVNASNSATSTAIVNCIFPGLGGFLSPVIFTNLTTALGGESTVYRFKFVAVVALICGVILIGTTWLRSRRNAMETPVVPVIE